MNKTKTLFATLLLAFAIAAPVALTPGCALTRTHEAVVFDSFKTTYNQAYIAYTSFLELVVKGKVSKEKEAKVDAAWNEFRAAFSIAFQTASQDWNATTPEQVQKLSDNLIAIIRSL